MVSADTFTPHCWDDIEVMWQQGLGVDLEPPERNPWAQRHHDSWGMGREGSC